MANRVLGDLEFRGHTRPITEEFNLAANYNEIDVCNAEFYRTFGSASFCGRELLTRLRAAKEELKNADTKAAPIRKRAGYQRLGNKFFISLEEAYGYRGNAPAVYYLSPWEFTALWKLDFFETTKFL